MRASHMQQSAARTCKAVAKFWGACAPVTCEQHTASRNDTYTLTQAAERVAWFRVRLYRADAHGLSHRWPFIVTSTDLSDTHYMRSHRNVPQLRNMCMYCWQQRPCRMTEVRARMIARKSRARRPSTASHSEHEPGDLRASQSRL